MTHATTWVKLEDIMLSEISQTQRTNVGSHLYEVVVGWWFSGMGGSNNRKLFPVIK